MKAITVTALLALSASPALAATLCEQVKENNSAPYLLAEKSGGIIKLEERSSFGYPPDYAKKDIFEFQNVATYSLGDSGAVALESIEGTLHCQSLDIYDSQNGAMKKIATPFDTEHCAAKGNSMIGTIAGAPALIANRYLSGAVTRATIIPWADHKWGALCTVTMRHAKNGRILSVQTATGTAPSTEP